MHPLKHVAIVLVLTNAVGALGQEPSLGSPEESIPIEEVIRSARDLWGEAAMRQENGPNYEFFEGLLPPPGYVNASFRHYPSSVQLADGRILTAYYSRRTPLHPRYHMGVVFWSVDDIFNLDR